MDTTDTTNLEAPEAEEVVTEPTESEEPDEADVDTEEPSDEDNPEGLTEAELLEIELEGKQFKLPKDVEPFLMRQKDYTQKTQALAEERRFVEAEREELQQERAIVSQVGRDISILDQMNERLEYLRSVDPMTLHPQKLAQYLAEKAGLENEFTLLNQQTTEKVEALRKQQVESEARRNEANWRKVTTPNPNIFWDGKFDQTRSQELTKFAADTLGISPDVQRALGPEFVATFNLAKVGLETLRKQTQALTKPKVEAKPVPEVSGKKSFNALSPRDMDRLPIDQWMKAEERRMAKNAHKR